MIDFETAARKAAKAAFDVIRHIVTEHPDLFEKTNETHWAARDILEIEITKHYASLAEVQGKLVELAAILDNEYPTRELISDDGKCYETYDTLPVSLRAILADPQISALIERMRG